MSRQKFLKLFFALSFFVVPVFSFAQTTDQTTLIQQLQRQVAELQKQIQALQTQITETKSELGSASPATEAILTEPTPPEFTRNLFRGSSGDDVRKLQEFLAKDKEIYPDGLVTGFFGPLTEKALKKWQEKHGIESVGFFGPKTIAKFKELGKGVIEGLLQSGAGASGVIPPGLEKKFEEATTTIATTTPPTTATTTPVKIPPRPGTCAASNAYCINPDECSQNGYYWCRNSCYTIEAACLGQTFVAPAQPATPAVSATPAIPAQSTSQTGTTTVSATPAISATPATVATTTTTTSDTTAPIISGVSVSSITSNSAVITWVTNERADSQVEYGSDTTYGSQTALDTVLIDTGHTATISGLTPSTTYHYKVKSKDASGNLAVSSDYTFTTAITPSGLSVVGFVSDAPKLKNPWSVAVSGNFAYVTSNGVTSGFTVIDISNPSSPVVKGSLSDSRLSDATAVAVSGNYAYVAAAGASGISVIDISNSDSPQIVGFVSHSSMNRAWSLAISGNYAYVAGLYASSLAVVNISNPQNPFFEGSASVPSPQTISVSGNYAFVGAGYSNRIYSFNISSTTPQLISSLDDVRLKESWGSYIVGNYLYTTSVIDDRLTIVDISDPANMKVVGTIQDSTNLDGAYGVVVEGKYAYVPAAFANRLTVIDVSNPTNPKINTSIKDDDKFNQPTAVALFGNYAYIPARYKSGLAVVDISKVTAAFNTSNSWRLAQILESLNNILNSLKLLR